MMAPRGLEKGRRRLAGREAEGRGGGDGDPKRGESSPPRVKGWEVRLDVPRGRG